MASAPRNTPSPDAVEAEDRQFIIALARGLRVLQAFAPGDDILTNAELAARTRLPKTTITRITYTLSRLGYLSVESAGAGYRIDPHVLTLGFPVLARLGIRELARPMMQAIADRFGASVFMGLRDGLHMIFVERVRSGSSAMQQDIGTRVPLATTALGRAHLAALQPEERAAVIEEIRASGLPEWWAPVREAMEREFARYRDKGYCFGGTWDPDVTGVAVPLSLPGRTLISMSCGAPRERLPEDLLHEAGEQLKALVRRVQMVHGGAN